MLSRTPAIEVMSPTGTLRPSLAPIRGGAAKARAAAARVAAASWKRRRMRLEGQEFEQQVDPAAHRAGGVADDALALQLDLQVADLGREHGVVGGDVGGADDAVDDEGLLLVVHLDGAHGLNHEIAIGQQVHDAAGEAGGEGGGGGGGGGAFEIGLGVGRDQGLELAGRGQVAEEAAEAGVGVELALGLHGAGAGGLRGLDDVDGDEVVDVLGFEVAGEVGVARAGRPQAAGGGRAGGGDFLHPRQIGGQRLFGRGGGRGVLGRQAGGEGEGGEGEQAEFCPAIQRCPPAPAARTSFLPTTSTLSVAWVAALQTRMRSPARPAPSGFTCRVRVRAGLASSRVAMVPGVTRNGASAGGEATGAAAAGGAAAGKAAPAMATVKGSSLASLASLHSKSSAPRARSARAPMTVILGSVEVVKGAVKSSWSARISRFR